MKYTCGLYRTLVFALSICWSATALSGPEVAREKPSPPPHAHEGHKRAESKAPATKDWAGTLQLDGKKAEQVKAAEQKYHAQRRELTKKHYAEMMELEKNKLESLQDVLTPEQLAQLQALWTAQMRDAHSRHH